MLNLTNLKEKKIALYGLGTETERFISENGNGLDILCLLDGFRQDGELYGFPIMPLDEAISCGVEVVIVIARPGSCKVIAKRIRESCIQSGIAVFDVRGNDLLVENKVIYDYKNIHALGRNELIAAIDASDAVSFDLFDTLVSRKTMSYTDVFELVGRRLERDGIVIEDFSKKRLFAEKELSVTKAPRLEEIYERLLSSESLELFSQIKEALKTDSPAYELSELEWKTDYSLMDARQGMADVVDYCISKGKKVFITSDCYYNEEKIKTLLEALDITGFKNIIISSQYGHAKNQGLFDMLKEKAMSDSILHIGDDEYADVACAEKDRIKAFKLLSGMEIYEALGGLGCEPYITNLADRIKVGLFINAFFSDPFVWERDSQLLAVSDAWEIGYLFCGSMITDFALWLKTETEKESIAAVLLCARDGFLLHRMYKDTQDPFGYKCIYFLTSRTAAIRAGVRNAKDIDYVSSMKYFGNPVKELDVRYGIKLDDSKELSADEKKSLILKRAGKLRAVYQQYSDEVGVPSSGDVAVFDFVAKGTTQLFLGNILTANLKGYYFLQLEPEFMADKGLEIIPFYTEKERASSEIFNSYYILETILSSPEPSLQEFYGNGEPLYDKETRSPEAIECVLRAQQGVLDFYKDYIQILGLDQMLHDTNKKLDEVLLALIGKVKILDKDFMSLVIEDPFFGRMTDIKDVL